MGAPKARELGAVGAGRRPVRRRGARLAHRTPARVLSGRSSGGCGHGYVTAEQVAEHLHRLPPRTGCRAASTPSATPRSAPSWKVSRSPRQAVGVDALRAARHRVEHAEIMDKALIARFVEYGIFASDAARLRPALGRRAPDVRPAPRRGPQPGQQPDGADAPHRGRARLRLGLAGHPAGPVGQRAGRDVALQPGAADERQGRVRRAHPRRLARGAPRQRGRAGAARPGHLRRLARPCPHGQPAHPRPR